MLNRLSNFVLDQRCYYVFWDLRISWFICRKNSFDSVRIVFFVSDNRDKGAFLIYFTFLLPKEGKNDFWKFPSDIKNASYSGRPIDLISFCREKKTLNISPLLQKLGRNFVNKNIMDKVSLEILHLSSFFSFLTINFYCLINILIFLIIQFESNKEQFLFCCARLSSIGR